MKRDMKALLAKQDAVIMRATDRDFIRLLWAKVAFLPTGCWHRIPEGTSFNPRVWLFGVRVGAHRLALCAATRAIPEGMYCLHTCGNGKCIRPSHLRWGSPKENSDDRIHHYRKAGRDAELCRNLLGIHADEIVREVWFAYFVHGYCVPAIAKEFCMDEVCVYTLLTRKRRRAVTDDLVGDYAQESKQRQITQTNRSSSRWYSHQKVPNRISDDDVRAVRNLLQLGLKDQEIAATLGIKRSSVKNVRKNIAYTHIL